MAGMGIIVSQNHLINSSGMTAEASHLPPNVGVPTHSVSKQMCRVTPNYSIPDLCILYVRVASNLAVICFVFSNRSIASRGTHLVISVSGSRHCRPLLHFLELLTQSLHFPSKANPAPSQLSMPFLSSTKSSFLQKSRHHWICLSGPCEAQSFLWTGKIQSW